jgi:murein L,D-transpeptidase YafK
VAAVLSLVLLLAGCTADPYYGEAPVDATPPAADSAAEAEPAAPPPPSVSTTPMPPKPPTAERVVVYKGARKMHLMSDGYVFATFPIALGFNPRGHKQAEGDGRTPEGRYVLDWRNPNSRFHKSIHISYPNALDRRAARKAGRDPGGAIMIHGVPPDYEWMGRHHTVADWTDGCIAVTNAEMDRIWRAVPDGTPIVIHP